MKSIDRICIIHQSSSLITRRRTEEPVISEWRSVSVFTVIGDHHRFEGEAVDLAHALGFRLQLAAGDEMSRPRGVRIGEA